MKKDKKGNIKRLQRMIKIIIGLFGGIVTCATLGIGLCFIINFSLISVGVLTIGMSLLEPILTMYAVKSVEVYSVEEIKKDNGNLSLIKIESAKEKKNEQVEFTKISPSVHLEIVDSNKRYSRVKK